MIDIHCHPLPYVDDGAADWEAALEMARLAAAGGITQWITTPHWTGQAGEIEETARIRAELQERLRRTGIALRIHAGNEVVLLPHLAEALAGGTALPLAGSRYLLLETAQLDRGAYILSALFQLQTLGYRVILAHPERLRAWQEDLDDLRELLFRGCYLQLNAGSLRGAFGRPAQKTAERLLKLGWVTFLASDTHSPDRRPPHLSDVVELCSRVIGPAAARELVQDNPSRVLCDEHIEPVRPELPPAGRFRWLPWLRGR